MNWALLWEQVPLFHRLLRKTFSENVLHEIYDGKSLVGPQTVFLLSIEMRSFRHRNLSTRTHMFELLLQTFWAKKLVKVC
jgi:hypothetical protein